MTATTNRPSVHSSRWGFHNSNYETYRKLKALHGLYLEARRRAAAWERWHRKEPHNRVARPEPALCPVFSKKVRKTTNFWRGKFIKDGRSYETVETSDHGVVEAYYSTWPVADAADVRPLPISVETIDGLYQKAGLK
jgi:hypothetical protein